jgi:hypothetical protein
MVRLAFELAGGPCPRAAMGKAPHDLRLSPGEGDGEGEGPSSKLRPGPDQLQNERGEFP